MRLLLRHSFVVTGHLNTFLSQEPRLSSIQNNLGQADGHNLPQRCEVASNKYRGGTSDEVSSLSKIAIFVIRKYRDRRTRPLIGIVFLGIRSRTKKAKNHMHEMPYLCRKKSMTAVEDDNELNKIRSLFEKVFSVMSMRWWWKQLKGVPTLVARFSQSLMHSLGVS